MNQQIQIFYYLVFIISIRRMQCSSVFYATRCLIPRFSLQNPTRIMILLLMVLTLWMMPVSFIVKGLWNFWLISWANYLLGGMIINSYMLHLSSPLFFHYNKDLTGFYLLLCPFENVLCLKTTQAYFGFLSLSSYARLKNNPTVFLL